MKKSLLLLMSLFIVIGLMSVSCVPSKKLDVSEQRATQLQKDNAEALNKLNICNAEVMNLKKDKTSLEDEYSSVQKDLTALSNQSKMTISEQARRLRTLQDRIQSQRDIMIKLKNSIADALMNYKTDELYIYIKDGSVYVSLEEKLLFKSGSDLVDIKGKEALKSLAAVLNGTQDIMVVIEGHTDNIPIKNKLFTDNWALSTARANSILRIITTDYGFDPVRITASGRGQFHPIKTNDTEEGRAANRRTEIILSPNLSEIYQLLYQ
jgi:chemotaxis protein MotB